MNHYKSLYVFNLYSSDPEAQISRLDSWCEMEIQKPSAGVGRRIHSPPVAAASQSEVAAWAAARSGFGRTTTPVVRPFTQQSRSQLR